MAYERVVVALDVFAGAADAVTKRALRVCGDARVEAVHVVDVNHWYLGDHHAAVETTRLRDDVMEEAGRRLEALCGPAGIEHGLLVDGRPADEIHRFAEARRTDLVVMGAHGRHGWRLLLGSTANAVLHGTKCDVLCVHIPEEVEPYGEVLAAVDATDDARVVVARAVEVAAISKARVSLVSIVPPLEHSYASAVYADVSADLRRRAEAHVHAHLDALADDFPLTGERLARWGNPGREIRAAAEELSADLVVVGTHGRHGLGLLLGSTANAVLHGAQSDILAVRVAHGE